MEVKNSVMLKKLIEKLDKMTDIERAQYLVRVGLSGRSFRQTNEELAMSILNVLRVNSAEKAKNRKYERHSSSGFGIRNVKVDNHWVDFTNRPFKIIHPTLLCFGGNGVISTQKANGFCGIAERLIGLRGKEFERTHKIIDLLGFYYGTDNKEQTAGKFIETERKQVLERLLLPLFLNENGSLVDLSVACNNFSMVNFFSHCHGGSEVRLLLSDLREELIRRGYTEDDVKLIYSYSMQVSYSTLDDTSLVPTVRIESMTDSFHRGMSKEYERLYKEKLDGISLVVENEGEFKYAKRVKDRNYKLLTIYTSRLLNLESNRDMSRLIDEHTIEYLDRDQDWNITEKAKGAKNADLVSILIGYALDWALSKSASLDNNIKGKKKTNFDELINDLGWFIDCFSPEDLKI